MNAEKMDNLWEKYIAIADIAEYQKKYLKTLGKLLMQEIFFLYKIYAYVLEEHEEEISERSANNVYFEIEDNTYILRTDNGGIVLKKEAMQKLIIDMIGLFEDILPLGSVVDLKKEGIIEDKEIENFRVVITKRFLGTGEGCYYPYGGVVYPLGIAGSGNVLYRIFG